MKNMKKILAIILSLSLVLSMSVPSLVMADTPGPAGANGKTVTITNTESGHTYEAYQLFSGELVTEYEEFDLTGYTPDNADSPTSYTKGSGTNAVTLTIDGNKLKNGDEIVAVKDGGKWYTAGKNNDGKKAKKKTLTNAEFGTNLDYTTPKAYDGENRTFIGALNHKFGAGITEPADYSALTPAQKKDLAETVLDALGQIEDGENLADLMNVYIKGDAYAVADTKDSSNQYKLTGLEEGYYFIKDKDNSLSNTPVYEKYTQEELANFTQEADGYYNGDVKMAEPDGTKLPKNQVNTVPNSYTDFILQVVEDTEVKAKANTPSIDKKIVETTDVQTGQLKQYEINGVKQYHLRSTDSQGNSEPLYYALDTNGKPIISQDSHVTTDTGYPVPTTNTKGGKDGNTDLDPIYCNENGDFYALRVDENTASIGEWVRYEIPVTMPTMEGYNKYFMIVSDTLCAGLSLPGDAAEEAAHPLVVKMVYSDGSEVVLTKQDWGSDVREGAKTYEYQTTPVSDTAGEYVGGTKFEIVINDAIQYKYVENAEKNPVQLLITYEAKVNNKAIIGNPGNPNKVTLEYSRDPNVKDDGTKNKPSKTGITGVTPEEETRTYVTELILKKTDEDGRPLTGAKFLITGTSQIPTTTVTERYIPYTDTTPQDDKDDTHPEITKNEVKYYELKDGTFTDQKPKPDKVENGEITEYGNYVDYKDYSGTVDTEGKPTPNYTTQEAVDNVIKPTHYHYIETTVSYVTQELGTYKVADSAHPATHYQVKGANYATDNTDVTYTTTEPTASTAATYVDYDGSNLSSITKTHYLEAGRELTVGGEGYLDLSGLGAGLYTIKELEAPAGFNLLRYDIEVKIEFTTDDDALTSTNSTDHFVAHWKKSTENSWTQLSLGSEAILVNHKEGGDNAYKELENNYYLLPIVNRSGNELPETGGIGTKIFYTLGAILVLLAGILLITRRRMAHQK